MSKKDTWFDAFFDAVTRSNEFKKVMEKDWKWDLSKSLKDMEKNIAKAGEITEVFKKTFGNSPLPNSPYQGEGGTAASSLLHKEGVKGGQKHTKAAWEDTRKISVTPKYFTMKNPDTWGFKGFAGMQTLKDELTNGFIKPLQFLFLVKDLKEKYETLPESEIDTPKDKWSTERSDNTEVVQQQRKEKILVDLYKTYETFQVWIPTGMLLYGPPGTGKTFLTKKLAQELGAGLITKSVWEFGSSYLHETSKNIREFFSAAKKASEAGPIILFLDEIDSLVSKRTDRVDGNKAEEVSQFLQEFNKLEEAPNLIVVAATNRPDHLDSALLRSGRLDKKYYIWPPDFTARKELFEIFIEKQKRPHGKLNYEKLAELTDGYVAADIEAIIEEAARDASGNILDMAQKIQNYNGDISEIETAIKDHKITQWLLELAIADTVSSLKMVDMSVFEKWEETIK